jgi:hypothetical protein
MTVRNKKIVDYIQNELFTIAKNKTASHDDQLVYCIGFLIAQLAQTFEDNSDNLYKFKAAVRAVNS